MTTTSEKILKDIKEKHISPKPRWEFRLKNWVFWGIFAASLFIGALSFAVILDLLINHDWDIYLYLHKTFWQFILLSLPYLWIMLVALFFGIAYFEFVHTRGWYHHRVYLVVLASVASSAGLGVALFYSGVGKKIDLALDEKIPFYGVINLSKRSLWCHPEKGLLGGEITKMQKEQPEVIVVKDCHGNEWLVMKPMMPPPPTIMMRVGERIKAIGKEIEHNRFEAEEFRNW
jgi:hypothetical protein